MKQDAYRHYLETQSNGGETRPYHYSPPSKGIADELAINCENLRIDNRLSHLCQHLPQNDYIEHFSGFDESLMDIFSRDSLDRIASRDKCWENMVPEKTAAFIKENQLFGYEPFSSNAFATAM